MRKLIESRLFKYNNVKLQASIDPSISNRIVNNLKKSNWSTMFFGDDTATENRYKCPKTWKKMKGHCSICKKGCFSKNRVDIHLKQH